MCKRYLPWEFLQQQCEDPNNKGGVNQNKKEVVRVSYTKIDPTKTLETKEIFPNAKFISPFPYKFHGS